MRKKKIDILCECGNTRKWTIYVRGGLYLDGKSKPHTYWFSCNDCSAEIKLGFKDCH